MIIDLNESSPTPLYQQLRDRIVEGIARGDLRHGETLTPVRQLAAAFGINPATVAKAYDQLKAEGLVYANRKAGSVVTADPATTAPPPGFVEDWTSRMNTLVAEGVIRGLTHEQIRTSTDTVLAQCNWRKS